MKQFGSAKVLLISVYLFGLLCSANDLRKVKTRIKHLEKRLNTEAKFRDEDIDAITERLDDIDKVLNAKVEHVDSAMAKTSFLDYETADSLKENFKSIRAAFSKVKSETERFRREILEIENNVISINNDITNYCQQALNKTEELMTNFEASSVSDGKILNEIIEQIFSVEDIAVNLETMSTYEMEMLSNIQKQMKYVRKGKIENVYELKAETASIEQISKQKQKVEATTTNLNSLLHYLFRFPSCLGAKNMGYSESGTYKLIQEFEVYCDLSIDDEAWTVFQRRLNGEVEFIRNWKEYKDGFGDLIGELQKDYLLSIMSLDIGQLNKRSN